MMTEREDHLKLYRKLGTGWLLLSWAVGGATVGAMLAAGAGLLGPGGARVASGSALAANGYAIIASGCLLAATVVIGGADCRTLAQGELARRLVLGTTAFLSLSFIGSALGKLAHYAEMRQFFAESGYADWFLAFITTAEMLGALGLWLPRTRLLAVGGLSLIMVGAIYTHYHNGDPLIQSTAAFRNLVLLVVVALLNWLVQRLSTRQAKGLRNEH